MVLELWLLSGTAGIALADLSQHPHHSLLQTELLEHLEAGDSPQGIGRGQEKCQPTLQPHSQLLITIINDYSQNFSSEGVPQTIGMGTFRGKGFSCFWDRGKKKDVIPYMFKQLVF